MRMNLMRMMKMTVNEINETNTNKGCFKTMVDRTAGVEIRAEVETEAEVEAEAEVEEAEVEVEAVNAVVTGSGDELYDIVL